MEYLERVVGVFLLGLEPQARDVEKLRSVHKEAALEKKIHRRRSPMHIFQRNG